MRRFRHWTPRYILNRATEILYQRMHPSDPWLTRDANMILRSLVRSQDVGLEFGSGRSTLWFAARVKHLTSVEHEEKWHTHVQARLKEGGFQNVTLHLCPSSAGAEHNAKYVGILDRLERNSLDFVSVDGICRGACALAALPKIRGGGFLLIDNVNWYLPCHSFSPNSRTLTQGPSDEVWAEVQDALSGWRRIWTTSGVTDTAFFFKGP